MKKQQYTVSKRCEHAGSDWLAARINYRTIKFYMIFWMGRNIEGVRIVGD